MKKNTAKSNFSKIDEYGFERPDDFDYMEYEEFMSKYLPFLARRAKKWSELLKQNSSLRPNNKLKRYIRKGIPSEHRPKVWLAISGANILREKEPQLYSELQCKDFMKDIVDSIKIDLPRTFPDNIYFCQTNDVQQQLFRILIAYAHYNTDVGYCQGMNYIAGLLLLVTKNEEQTFWLLLILLNKILPPNYYTQNMSGLITDINVFEKLVEIKDPVINKHLKDLGLAWPVAVTKWFVCLFAEVLPTETVLRIWDCMFLEGNKILFRVALALIRNNHNELLESEDFAAVILCFKSIVKNKKAYNCQEFMKGIFKESLSRRQIEDLRLKQR